MLTCLIITIFYTYVVYIRLVTSSTASNQRFLQHIRIAQLCAELAVFDQPHLHVQYQVRITYGVSTVALYSRNISVPPSVCLSHIGIVTKVGKKLLAFTVWSRRRISCQNFVCVAKNSTMITWLRLESCYIDLHLVAHRLLLIAATHLEVH